MLLSILSVNYYPFLISFKQLFIKLESETINAILFSKSFRQNVSLHCEISLNFSNTKIYKHTFKLK
ncbi:hypothetical protein BpHYR1_011645 [Brachionus plicatilis]|uniref:Uncharacterized protein n=1 Tax=Brachionus plicatilis TaxID=10195 RepID=A0A3M7PF11_BRAPC|nr:hypothetical protein BpHYR1_011645 [Brachionus plicatilis]